MPVSAEEGKDWTVEQFRRLKPERVLDVGAGSGTYARLLRPVHRGDWTAIEVFEPYVEQFGLRDMYDDVWVGNLLDWACEEQFDLTIFGDVLEHLSLDQARNVLYWAKVTSRAVLVSVPIIVWEQGAMHGNEHEAHLHHFTFDEMAELSGAQHTWKGEQVGVFLWEAEESEPWG